MNEQMKQYKGVTGQNTIFNELIGCGDEEQCMLLSVHEREGGLVKRENELLASSLTALLHSGHKASQRYLWSQLGHGGRRRRRSSSRHCRPAER